MAKYKPGTLDDEAAFRRRFDETDRIARENALPLGSNVYQTTEKLENFDGNASEALAKANEALDLANSLPNSAGDGIDITNRVISSPEMTRGDVLSICTFSS